MPYVRFAPATRPLRIRKTRHAEGRLRPSGKQLDMLVLAGCSCLLTLLYHPVANALQSSSAQAASQSGVEVATHINATTNWAGAVHVTLPPKEETVVDEEDE